MQFPTDKLILLRGGIPPIIGTKIAYFSSRFFKTRAFPAPEVPAAPKRTPDAARPVLFRDMTAEEAAGHDTRPMSQDAVLTEDCRSEERRVGKECVSTCRSRWSTCHEKNKKK